ncbi:MAG: winged helix-turn-helix domain-containing protein [Caulobacteraceae bacterium]
MEDDAALAKGLKASLERDGFAVDWTQSGEDGCALGAAEAYDAVILDLGLPDLAGLKILKTWRSGGVDHPVLILTSRAAWTEKVEGLNAGADDYLAKPFEAGEVAARLHALIRRRSGRADPVLRRGDIELRPAEGLVRVAGQPMALTGRELRILMYLMQRPGRIVSEQDIVEHIYSMDDELQSNSVQVYISRLRRKLGRDAIKTFRGLGYRFS